METEKRDLPRWANVLLVLLGVIVLLGRGGAPPQDIKTRLNLVNARYTFNFVAWEVEALARKLAYSLLSAERFMNDEQQSRFVLAHLDNVRASQRLSSEISRLYTDPEIADPAAASLEERQELVRLRARMADHAPIAEAILESQVSAVLMDGGIGAGRSVFPPVMGTFTPLPHILVVSPRHRIESVYQQQLVPGLTAAEQEMIEERSMAEFPDHAAYVTEIGGLAAYPAMLMESASLDWVTDVIAHEWTHHYLALYPLGWYYMRDGEARTINETTASLVGEWAGQEVILRYYDPLLVSEKQLPNPLTVDLAKEEATARGFDFRAEMHHTRVVVDRLLAQDRIREAEWYMELRRRYFVTHGYQIRRLNQAYFAFHGAYASAPGAAGENPIGPLVRQTWAMSGSPRIFLRQISSVTKLQELEALVEEIGAGV